MDASAHRTQPEAVAAVELFDLVVTGPLRKVESNADGSWTVTPVVGRPLVLIGPDQVAAYVQQARGTGPQALAPAITPAPTRDAAGCECAPAVRAGSPQAHLLQARAVHRHLADWLPVERRAFGWNEEAGAASVRVASAHGLYELFIPPVGRPFPVFFNGRRSGALDARRVPAVSDPLIATLYAAYLRDRGEL